MRTFRIKESFWSWGDNFTITDADSGTACFVVKGKVFSWGDDLSFQDTQGNELVRIKQKLLNLLPRYEIQKDGAMFAEVRKEFTVFKDKFTLDIPGPNDYTIVGSIWERDFTFEQLQTTVARVTKKRYSWADSYAVEILVDDDEAIVAILATCIVIDQVLHDDKKK